MQWHFCLSTVQRTHFLKPKSQNWSPDWYVVILTKMNEKLTALFIGIRWVQNCEKRFRRLEGTNSRTLIVLDGRPLVCGLLVVRSGHPWPRNIFVCTFGSSEPVFGCWICSSCTTGTSTVLSVNFHSFLCLLRCWHLHQDCDFLHLVKEWNMWLSLCFSYIADWLQYIYEGIGKTRFQYCTNSRGVLLNIRAIQGHTGGNLMEPELMGHVAIPYKWKEILVSSRMLLECHFNLQIGTHRWRKRKQRRRTDHLHHTSQPLRGQSRRRRTLR